VFVGEGTAWKLVLNELASRLQRPYMVAPGSEGGVLGSAVSTDPGIAMAT
jgi:hypothetical protein